MSDEFEESKELPELERLDRWAREDLGKADSNIGVIVRARNIRALVAALRRARERSAADRDAR